ncbi:hypothetical protein OESDEN_25245 [Oesophagostomum dentatum]|uniref:Uncharacterized protein n=1 Tax=Oesophagostomum dentatum TaxID=61180 RepID=A0A0B1RR96_OESDE|nr:hypothetical protein OESDEN_25245 [Oesophagostomum dentatum]
MMSSTSSSMMSTTSGNSEKAKSPRGFQEVQVVKKRVSAGNKGNQSDVNIEELMKALRVVRKAKERNIDLTTSMESLAMRSLKPRHKRRRSHRVPIWQKIRSQLYVALWIFAIVYFIALLNRNSVCPYLMDVKTAEF